MVGIIIYAEENNYMFIENTRLYNNSAGISFKLIIYYY